MAVQNSLRAQQGREGLASYLGKAAVKAQVEQIVGAKGTPTFISSIVSAVQTTPTLQECSNASILSAALLGESLHLSPSPQLGMFYMVPFNNAKKGYKEAQFQLGYKGYIQLAIRSGMYKKLNVLAIKEGELARFDPLDETIEVNLIPDPDARERAETIGYYAMFEYVNGFRKAIYWTKAQMEQHAKTYSKGYAAKKGYTFWEKNFDAMAYKTMLRQLISKWGIMSIDLATALTSDNAVIHSDGTKEVVEDDLDIIDMPQSAQEPQEAPGGVAVAESTTDAPKIDSEPVQSVRTEAKRDPHAGMSDIEREFFSRGI